MAAHKGVARIGRGVKCKFSGMFISNFHFIIVLPGQGGGRATRKPPWAYATGPPNPHTPLLHIRRIQLPFFPDRQDQV